MDYQGAHEEQEGRPGGPEDLKTAGGVSLALSPLPGPPGLPAFLLALPGLPSNPSSYPYLEACLEDSFIASEA